MSFLSTMNSFIKSTTSILKENFDIPILIGGGHPTVLPEYVISDHNVDMICIGEGEGAIVELADRMEKNQDYSNILNLWIKTDKGIVKNTIRPLLQDLDSLPFPDRDLFYRYGCFAGNLYFISGRGCPFQCTYCCEHSFREIYKGRGKYNRLSSIYNIISEL